MAAHACVGIHHQPPIGIGDLRVFCPRKQRLGLRFLAPGHLIADISDTAHLLQPDQHVIGAVLAIIGVGADVVEPGQAVIGDPFQLECPSSFIVDRIVYWCLAMSAPRGRSAALNSGPSRDGSGLLHAIKAEA